MKHHWSVESRTLAMLFFVTLVKSINTTSGCSCYTFQTNSLNWKQSNEYCKGNSGNLVSMETEQEYQFINKSMQNLNKGINEWYIGLSEKTTGVWKWINGRSLSINKWQPREPSRDGSCVVMAKNWPPGKYGLFNDLRCSLPRMFICEYNTGHPCGQQSIIQTWCNPPEITTVTAQTAQYFTTAATVAANTHKSSTTSSTTTSLPTSQLITSEQISPTWPFTAIHNKPTTKKDQLDTTLTIVEDERSPLSTSQKSPKFQMVIVVAVLGVLLAVSVCLLSFACYWKRRKRAHKQEINNGDTNEGEQPSNQWAANRNSTEGVQLFHQNSVKPYVTYAVISNNQAPSTSNKPTYASIEDKKGLKRPCGLENGPNPAIPAVTARGEDYFVDSVGGIKSNMEVVYASVNKEKAKSQGISDEGMTKSIRNSNQDGKQCPAEQQVLYACADKSKKNNTRPEEVLYAEIGSNAEGQQPYQITYAELIHFNQNPPKEEQKTAPYQQTVYAVIDQKPKS